MFDSHMHTPLCRHAVGTPDEYAAAAHARGLEGIIVTCHNPLPNGLSPGPRMTCDMFDTYLYLIDCVQAAWKDKLDIRLGLECDYLPTFDIEKWLTDQVNAADFDYLLVSVHMHLPEYRERFWRDDPVAYQRTYFQHLAESAELKLHDCVAHPDLVKNVTADEWDVSRIIDDVRHCLDRIAKTGLAMEINTSGWKKSLQEQNPCMDILREIAERQIPIVPGSDSHEPGRVGDRFVEALDLLTEAGFSHISQYRQRQRREVLIADARASLCESVAGEK